jgi:hypothetical protein
MIVSFAWTTPSFLALRKSATRRDWDDEYAKQFTPGSVHQANDKSPRFGGQKIGSFVVKSCTKEHMSNMPDSDYEAEGFKYMEEQGLEFRGQDPRGAFEEWRREDKSMWVLRIGILSVKRGDQICLVSDQNTILK